MRISDETEFRGEGEKAHARPDSVHLMLHPDLLVLETGGRLARLFLGPGLLLAVDRGRIEALRSPAHDLDVPKLESKVLINEKDVIGRPDQGCQTTYLVDHVAFRVPALVALVPLDLDELLQDGRIASGAFRRPSGRVVIMTKHVALVLVIAILRPEQCRTDAASKVLDVVLLIAGGDVRPAEGGTARGADEVEPAEVVAFAERLLAVGRVDGEEFLRDDVAAVHAFEAV